jgi:hypothetical protein
MREQDKSSTESVDTDAAKAAHIVTPVPSPASPARQYPLRDDAWLKRLASLAEQSDDVLTSEERADVHYAGDVLTALASIAVAHSGGGPARYDDAELARRTRAMRAWREALETDRIAQDRMSETLARTSGVDEGVETEPGNAATGQSSVVDSQLTQWSEDRIGAVAARIEAAVDACVAAAQLPIMRLDWTLAERAPSTVDAGLPIGTAVERAATEGCVPWEELSVAAGAGRELWDAPCERWIELPHRLTRRRGARYVALTITGDSMAPLLHPRDVVLVQLTTRLVRGAIAVVRRPDDGYVVKRVAAIRARRIELDSLNAAYAPIQLPRDQSLVVGVVVARWSRHPNRLPANAE